MFVCVCVCVQPCSRSKQSFLGWLLWRQKCTLSPPTILGRSTLAPTNHVEYLFCQCSWHLPDHLPTYLFVPASAFFFSCFIFMEKYLYHLSLLLSFVGFVFGWFLSLWALLCLILFSVCQDFSHLLCSVIFCWMCMRRVNGQSLWNDAKV